MKAIIKKKDLPPISANDIGYNLRFRLISQDRNRSSFWTPLYTIVAASATMLTTFSVTKSGNNPETINMIWEDPEANPEYDIFANYLYSNSSLNKGWEYKGSTSGNSYSLIAPAANQYQVSIQRSVYPKKRSPANILFETSPANL